ncbi:MAG: hypothetical protein AB1758_04590 [Candidatus Eremiobacterota bacterium]
MRSLRIAGAAIALWAGLSLSAQAQPRIQADFCVLAKDGNRITVCPADAREVRCTDYEKSCDQQQKSTITLQPRTCYVETKRHENGDVKWEVFLTEAEFVEWLEVGDVIEVEGTGSPNSLSPLTIWVHR